MPAKGSTIRVAVKCLVCGKEQQVHPSRSIRYKTCSKECMGRRSSVLLANKILTECRVCGTGFYIKPSHSERRKTCSKQCLAELKREQMSGDGNHQYGRRGAERGKAFKAGRFISSYGYMLTLVDGKYVFEHRHIMELHIGRALSVGEVVHHKNHDRLDNRIENLEIMTRKAHSTYHGLKDRQPQDKVTGRFVSREGVKAGSQGNAIP